MYIHPIKVPQTIYGGGKGVRKGVRKNEMKKREK
jgi:hypothetical protein